MAAGSRIVGVEGRAVREPEDSRDGVQRAAGLDWERLREVGVEPCSGLDARAAIERWRTGAEAQVWRFHVSLRRLFILVEGRGADGALLICAVGCRRISGPFSWTTEALVASVENGTTIVADAAGFRLECADVVAATGPVSTLQEIAERQDESDGR